MRSACRDALIAPSRRQLPLLILLLFGFILSTAQAQTQTQTPQSVDGEQADTRGNTPNADDATTDSDNTATATLVRLDYIQSVLSQKIAERSQLGEAIRSANEQDQDDLRVQADELSNDIQQLRKTLETLAIGGVDSSLFTPQEEEAESNWREDISLIAQPVIDSLKELTEKPRRLKELNDSIALHQQEADTANQALQNLAPLLERDPQGELAESLQRMQKQWQGRLDDARNDIEIARFQIAELQGDKTLLEAIIESLLDFLSGRGLTILLAILAACAMYYGVRFLMRGYRSSLADRSSPEGRTRYRLAAYSVQALTFLLILIAVFVVFYQRGDVLLLGLLILLIVGLALGVRNLLPRYLSEARLLLNIGPMREAERIVYRGLPWRVESINMFTVLRNPELHGVLRIPLAEFHGMTSRPSGKDPWFPTSRGDMILLQDQELVEVIEQNPDTVELKHRGGQITSVPSHEFYMARFTNLSRGKTFGVTGRFRIDYRHLSISTSQVPGILSTAIREAIGHSDLAEFLHDVRVELELANESSIDYWILVTCDHRAARSYQRIERLIQSACIEACSEASLGIPFPQLSLSRRAD